MPTPDELKAAAAELREKLAAADAAVAASEGAEPEPQNADEAFEQLLKAIVSHLGNHPKLEAKLEKLYSFKKEQPA